MIRQSVIDIYSDSIRSNRLGYYQVGDQVFFSKAEALIYATKTGNFPRWNFNQEIFDRVDWTKPNNLSLVQAYQTRARQLRDSYNYISISYSGGSDSSNALQSFLQAGIEPDEIFTWWPIDGTKSLYRPNANPDISNWFSEWDLSLKPDLDWIRSNYPKIKINFVDTSANLSKPITDLEFKTINSHSPGSFTRFGTMSKTEFKSIDSGKSATTVWGNDKPQFAFFDGKLHFYFIDKLANYTFLGGAGNSHCELFYWSPDAIDLIKTQVWTVYQALLYHPAQTRLLDHITWYRDGNSMKPCRYQHDQKIIWDQVLRGLIYPHWNPNKYQTNKPEFGLDGVGDRDLWLWRSPEYKTRLESWRYELNNLKSSIDPKFYQINSKGEFTGWTGFISPFYEIGRLV